MKRAFLISIVALAFLMGFVSLNTRSISSNSEQQKSKVLKQIEALNSVRINADNQEGCKLYIQEATVKEISAEDFKILVGEPSRHFRESTYPEATLLNDSGKTIKSFAVVVQSAADKSRGGRILFKKELSILPGAIFQVRSSDWLLADRVTVESEGKFINKIQQPPMDSAKSWIPGASSDLKLTIALVEFDDGTKWMISPDSM
jgi:hypothetical protein